MHPALFHLLSLLGDIAPTIETPTTALLKAGPLGAGIVALAGAVVYLYRDSKKEIDARDVEIRKRDERIGALQQQHVTDLAALQKQRADEQSALQKQRADEQSTLQAQRVSDAQQVSERLLRVNEQVVTALTNVNSSMEAQKDAMMELRDAFKELGREFRGAQGQGQYRGK